MDQRANRTRSSSITVSTDETTSPEFTVRREMTARLISDLRGRLLDLTNKNRLLNFRFSERARTHVRIINEIPDVLYGKLIDGKKLTFIPLPDPEEELEDERSDDFFLAFEAARRSDEEYLGRLRHSARRMRPQPRPKTSNGHSRIGYANN
jgi:hypothetical protein